MADFEQTTRLNIGEVARQAGLLPTTLRFYESIGLLPEPIRENGRRRYDASVFQRLDMIQTAQQAGFTLAEMRVLFDEILAGDSSASVAVVAKWNTLIQTKLQEMNRLLVNIQNMKSLLEDILHCDDAHLAECMVMTGQKHKQQG